ncbi:MAG: ATP-binding protein [Bacteroidota bacterium]
MVVYQKRLIDQKTQLQETELNQQKLLLRASIQSEESERKRIAENLHDEVMALLNTARIGISQVLDDLESDSKSFERSYASSLMISEALERIRSLSRDLKPPVLGTFGLVAGLRELCNKSYRATGIQVKFISPDSVQRLDPFIEISLYRIVCELLQNSIKHAQPSLIEVEIFSDNSFLKVSFRDDGKGFDFENELVANQHGSGLRNIQSRVQAIKGEIRFEKNYDKGLLVNILIIL